MSGDLTGLCLCLYDHTCKIWISPVSDKTYLNILDRMKSPEKGDSSGQMPTWADLHVAKLSRTRRPATYVEQEYVPDPYPQPNGGQNLGMLELLSDPSVTCKDRVPSFYY